MTSRDKLKKAAIKYKSNSLLDSYKHVRNRINSLNKKLKMQYYADKISAHKGDMKQSWKAINEPINKRSKSTISDSLKSLMGRLLRRLIFNDESKVIVYKSLHQLVPQYLSSMFIKNSNLCSKNLFFHSQLKASK